VDFFIYFLLGVIIIYVEITRKRYFVIDHLSFFNAFFFLVYVFAPIALKIMGSYIVPYDLAYGKYFIDKNPLMPFYILIAYLLFLAGYFWSRPRSIVSRFDIELKLGDFGLLMLILFGYAFLILIMVVYLQANGGLSRTIANAENFRSGTLVANKPYLVKLFALNQIFLYYSYYRVFLAKSAKYKNIFIALLLISVGIFFVRSALMNSRGFIIFTGLGLYVITAMYSRKYYLNFLLIGGFFGILFIKYGDPLFHALPDLANDGFDKFVSTFEHRIQRENLSHTTIVSNFLHPSISLTTALSLAGKSVDFRYFTDFYGAVIAIMPNSLIGIEEPYMVQSLVTKLLYGIDRPIVLPGILATFTFSLGTMGLFIWMFLYGIYGGILSEFFKVIYHKYQGSIVIIYALSMAYGYFVFRGSPKNNLLVLFTPLVVMGVLSIFTRIYYKKSNNFNYKFKV